MKLHQIIRKIRQSKDLTQENLAEEIGMTKDTIIRWEKDASVISIGDLEKIAKVFEMEVSDLLSYQHQENVVMDPLVMYKKKRTAMVTIQLDGTAATVEEWIKTIRKFNALLA